MKIMNEFMAVRRSSGIAAFEKKVRAMDSRLGSMDVHRPHSKERMAYLHVTAALYHLSDGGIQDEAAFFRSLRYNEELAVIERGMLPVISDRIKLVGNPGLLAPGKLPGRIICSFHCGSFFAVLEAFSRYSMDVLVGMSSEAHQKLKDDIEGDVRNLREQEGSTMNVELLDMGEPMSIFRLVRKLRSGGDVFLFVDADSGFRNHAEDSKVVRVPFLDGFLRVRNGAAQLSYLTGAVIVPFISRREEGNILLDVGEAIHPDPAMTVEEFGCHAVGRLFGILEEQVKRSPEQWEGWLYIHSMVEPRKMDEEYPVKMDAMHHADEYEFNNRRYAVISSKANHYLFDRQQYRMVRIPDPLFHVLDQQGHRGSWTDVGLELLEYLFRNRVLVPRTDLN
jgi:hypothetical protein